MTFVELEIKTYFYDDWHLITCDSALNAAVRNGHLDVVKILSSEKTNALMCKTYDGKTPIMTAVQYLRTDIFEYLLGFSRHLGEKCFNKWDFIDYDKTRLSRSETQELETHRCPEGVSIFHLIAILLRQYTL